ncbi:MAG: DUF3570 domain-containing protein [Myxococcaceae bacterium]
MQLYTDSDATVVVSPHAQASGTLESGTSVNLVYTEDVVSSASVDVRSSASPRIHDVRQEVDLGFGQTVGPNTFGVSAVHATEKDYLSNGASLSFSRELNQKNTTFAFRAGFMANVVGKAGDPTWGAPMNDGSADLALTQALSETTLVQLSTTLQVQEGFLASPYRKVTVDGGRFVLPEADPPRRNRVAAGLGLKRHFGGAGAGHLGYRFYTDSFGVAAHTVEARWTFELEPFSLRLRYRFYSQTGASFYQSSYSQALVYLCADRELSPFTSHLAGAKLEWTPPRNFRRAQLRFDLKVEGMYFDYADFPALKTRTALNAQAGAGVDF